MSNLKKEQNIVHGTKKRSQLPGSHVNFAADSENKEF